LDCSVFRLSLPHFALADDEMKILSGFPMNKINNLHSLEKEGEITTKEY
jgi:hypothetical protein